MKDPWRLRAVCPLSFEALAFRGGCTGASVIRTGMGPGASAKSAAKLREWAPPGAPVAIVGVGAGLDPSLRAGELVVASELRGPWGSRFLRGAPMLVRELQRCGLTAREGVVISRRSIVWGSERSSLAREGACLLDMESSWLADALGDRPLAVVRAVSDTSGTRPWALPMAGLAALRSLRKAAPALERWAGACKGRSVVLASPRSFCAGVERAIQTVETCLERYEGTVYVRRHIVHNRHVVADLEKKGARFVAELDDVPDGATVVFSAHGVAPSVRLEAERRSLNVVDATCPLVAKVHTEAKRFSAAGYEVVLIGHAGHDEIEGTMGEAPRTHLVATPDDVERLDIPPGRKVAYLSQTTLSPEDVDSVVSALRGRWPDLRGPAADDVCYATQNRQEALSAVLPGADVVIVVSSPTSSNGNRLAELAARHDKSVQLVEDASFLDLSSIEGASTIAVTAAASTPDEDVRSVVDALRSFGPLDVSEVAVTTEKIRFPLPMEVR